MPFDITCPESEPVLDPTADHAAVVQSAATPTQGVLCAVGNYFRSGPGVEPEVATLNVVYKIRAEAFATHLLSIPARRPAADAARDASRRHRDRGHVPTDLGRGDLVRPVCCR